MANISKEITEFKTLLSALLYRLWLINKFQYKTYMDKINTYLAEKYFNTQIKVTSTTFIKWWGQASVPKYVEYIYSVVSIAFCESDYSQLNELKRLITDDLMNVSGNILHIKKGIPIADWVKKLESFISVEDSINDFQDLVEEILISVYKAYDKNNTDNSLSLESKHTSIHERLEEYYEPQIKNLKLRIKELEKELEDQRNAFEKEKNLIKTNICTKCKRIKDISTPLHDINHYFRNGIYHLMYNYNFYKSVDEQMFKKDLVILIDNMELVISNVIGIQCSISLKLFGNNPTIPEKNNYNIYTIYRSFNSDSKRKKLDLNEKTKQPVYHTVSEYSELNFIMNNKKEMSKFIEMDLANYKCNSDGTEGNEYKNPNKDFLMYYTAKIVSPIRIHNAFQMPGKKIVYDNCGKKYSIAGFLSIDFKNINNNQNAITLIDYTSAFSDLLYKFLDNYYHYQFKTISKK